MEDTIEITPVESARAAGLRYVTDAKPGIQRKRVGNHFSYIGLDGKPIRDQKALQRIRSLAIPPAWTNVWICPDPHGHLQATGRDARGRKQYRYHPQWRKVRDETKYDKMVAFGRTLPLIRERVERDLKLPGLPREKVLAAIVRLPDITSVRIGNDEYARENNSFGLTTMRDDHVDIAGVSIHFQFRGKRGKEQVIDIRDRRLARIVKNCRDLPGQELFQYVDENEQRHIIESAGVNEYLKQISGQDFTAKDFRTWSGTVAAASTLQELGEYETQTQAKKNVGRAIEVAAQCLSNTPAICRKSYVHPDIITSYLSGSLLTVVHGNKERVEDLPEGLRSEEMTVLIFLQQ